MTSGEDVDKEDKDNEPTDGYGIPGESQRPRISPPTTPSTLAGRLSDIGLDTSARVTRASSRRDPDKDRREREDDEDLSDGDGSVYSELSIG